MAVNGVEARELATAATGSGQGRPFHSVTLKGKRLKE
jgi:hypothetical protein